MILPVLLLTDDDAIDALPVDLGQQASCSLHSMNLVIPRQAFGLALHGLRFKGQTLCRCQSTSLPITTSSHGARAVMTVISQMNGWDADES